MYYGFDTFREFYIWYNAQIEDFQRLKLQLGGLTTAAGHVLTDNAKLKVIEASNYIKAGQNKLYEMLASASIKYLLISIFDEQD